MFLGVTSVFSYISSCTLLSFELVSRMLPLANVTQGLEHTIVASPCLSAAELPSM